MDITTGCIIFGEGVSDEERKEILEALGVAEDSCCEGDCCSQGQEEVQSEEETQRGACGLADCGPSSCDDCNPPAGYCDPEDKEQEEREAMKRRRMQALKAIHGEMKYHQADERKAASDVYKDDEDWALLLDCYLAQLKYHDMQGHTDKVREVYRKIAAIAGTAMTYRGIVGR
jgi:hypothetical protein